MMGLHCSKHQPPELHFAILSCVQPRETGEKHQLARTKPKRKGASWGEVSDAFTCYLPPTKWQRNARVDEGMAVLLGICGVGGFCEALDPQSCLTQGPALTPLPKHPHTTGWCPSQEPDGLGVWKHEDRRFQGNLHTRSLSRADPELRVLQPAQPWWSLASATVKRHCCYSPDCPLRSAPARVLGSVFCFGITSVWIMLNKGSAGLLFLLIRLCFWLSLLMQDKFSRLQKSFLMKTAEFLCNEPVSMPSSPADFTRD